MENKELIVKALLPVLKMTDNLFDLSDLEYQKTGPCAEVVIATFRNGGKKTANVSMDSGTSMIRDIIGQII